MRITTLIALLTLTITTSACVGPDVLVSDSNGPGAVAVTGTTTTKAPARIRSTARARVAKAECMRDGRNLFNVTLDNRRSKRAQRFAITLDGRLELNRSVMASAEDGWIYTVLPSTRPSTVVVVSTDSQPLLTFNAASC